MQTYMDGRVLTQLAHLVAMADTTSHVMHAHTTRHHTQLRTGAWQYGRQYIPVLSTMHYSEKRVRCIIRTSVLNAVYDIIRVGVRVRVRARV